MCTLCAVLQGGWTVFQTGTHTGVTQARKRQRVHLFSYKTKPHYFLCPVGRGADSHYSTVRAPEQLWWRAALFKQWRSIFHSAFAVNVRERFKIQIAYENLIWHSSTWKLVLNEATTCLPEEIIYPENEEFAGITDPLRQASDLPGNVFSIVKADRV